MTPQSKLAAELAEALRPLVEWGPAWLVTNDKRAAAWDKQATEALAKYDSAQSAPERGGDETDAEDDRREDLKNAYVAGCRAVLRWLRPDLPQDDLDEGGYDYATSVMSSSPPDPDGWIEWKGGECPVAHDTLVYVKVRRDPDHLFPEDKSFAAFFGKWRWSRRSSTDEVIIAYRVARP